MNYQQKICSPNLWKERIRQIASRRNGKENSANRTLVPTATGIAHHCRPPMGMVNLVKRKEDTNKYYQLLKRKRNEKENCSR